jgi:acyl-CoA reductase-like NAD-dependent aldehyde dehydrogenase
MAIEYEVVSPVTGTTTTRIPLATKHEIAECLSTLGHHRDCPDADAVFSFLRRLADQIRLQKELFFETTYLETGFISRDSMEIITEAIKFLCDFEVYATEMAKNEGIPSIIPHSYSGNPQRTMRIVRCPARCVAAVLPQNAALTLGVIVIASALYAGSRVVLRPPLQSASSGALLARAVSQSEPPPSSIAIVYGLAEDFLEACYLSAEVDLIHYIGSSRYAPGVLARAFDVGKTCLIDGQGNGMLYVDDTFPLDEAIRIITTAGTRFNGETCTSVNGVLVKDSIYKDFKEAVVDTFQNLQVGHPLEQGIQVGPLFNQQQAVQLAKAIRDTATAKVLCGSHVAGAYFSPTVVEGVNLHDSIVREGLFGPAIWIAPVAENRVWDWLQVNRFPLSDAVLSTNEDLIQAFVRNSRAPRVCINADQSIESMFEPWGAYPPGGLNEVSIWTEKYRRAFVVDGDLNDVIQIPSYITG